jgi:hypothetical protein
MSDCCNAAVRRFVCGYLCCRRRFYNHALQPRAGPRSHGCEVGGGAMGARAAGGCLSALDPEIAMFQDEPVSAEAQQRQFGQVLGAAIGQPGLGAPGHSSLIAVDNRRAEPALGRLFFREYAIALQSARTRPEPKPRPSPGDARGCTVRRAQAVREGDARKRPARYYPPLAIRPSIFLVPQRTSGRPTAVSGNLLQLEGDESARLGKWPSERCGRRCWKAPA